MVQEMLRFSHLLYHAASEPIIPVNTRHKRVERDAFTQYSHEKEMDIGLSAMPVVPPY